MKSGQSGTLNHELCPFQNLLNMPASSRPCTGQRAERFFLRIYPATSESQEEAKQGLKCGKTGWKD